MIKMKKKIVLFITLLSLVIITTLTSVAIFSYRKTGSTQSVVTIGAIKFKYNEITRVGHGINIDNGMPITDIEGKSLNSEGEYFDFEIEADTTVADIKYEITVEQVEGSTFPQGAVKFYLTDITDTEEELEESINNSNEVKTLNEYEAISDSERKVYEGTVERNSRNYQFHIHSLHLTIFLL